MKLIDQIPLLRNQLIVNNEVDWDVYEQFEFTHQELRKTIDLFLKNLSANHSISGQDWYKLQGIGHWIREKDFATSQQEKFAIIIMSIFWDDLDFFKFY